MYDVILKQLEKRKEPIEVIVVGLGFMGFGFLSSTQKIKGITVPLLITRRVKEAKKFLEKNGIKAKIEHKPSEIKKLSKQGYICISNDINLIKTYKNKVVFEVTGTVAYGTEVSLMALSAKKHLITMNPELQATVGTKLKKIADKKGVIITDVIGDQPGSLTRLISQAKLMGFVPIVAGNMKRFMNKYATQEEMQPWADDKGLAVRQTTSFTDGTKQSIEMNLVANYYGMKLLKKAMQGPQVNEIKDAMNAFDFDSIPQEGVVDYVIGKDLFPGIFVIATHSDPNQQKYLRYLGLGDGPRYLLFEPYHLCHLEVAGTIAKVMLFNQETINNGDAPTTKTVAISKFNLKKGQKLDGIGGDTVYGEIYPIEKTDGLLPVGITDGVILKNDISSNQPIKISDCYIPENAATKLLDIHSTGEYNDSVRDSKPLFESPNIGQ